MLASYSEIFFNNLYYQDDEKTVLTVNVPKETNICYPGEILNDLGLIKSPFMNFFTIVS